MNASEGDPPAPPHDEDKAEQADEAAGSVVPDPANATETASRTNPIIVGVGASAGGLEALKAFLGGFPPAEHICIVVAQHMSPSRESLLRELLSPRTTFAVEYLTDSVRPLGGELHIIPPGSDAVIDHGKITLVSPGRGGVGPRPSVDRLFESMAAELGDRCIGVVLSGTGSDGARGLKAIHDAGGVGIAQDVESAQYDGMPRAAIDEGGAESVQPPENIGELIVALSSGDGPLQHPLIKDEIPEEVVERISKRMLDCCRIDLSLHKRSTLMRRIERRIRAHKLDSVEDYADLLAESESEPPILASEMRIGVTSFFRDPSSFVGLREQLTRLIDRQTGSDALRVWVPACSTGEEAYSVALTVADIFDSRQGETPPWTVFASDVNPDAVNYARIGSYPMTARSRIPERYHRYLDADGDHFIIKKHLRNHITFANHDVLSDPPFSRLHCITCRNLLIYLKPHAQRHVLSVLHYGLVPSGLLMLGQAESTDAYRDLFEPIDSRSKIYERTARTAQVNFPSAGSPMKRTSHHPSRDWNEPASGRRDVEQRTRTALAAQYAPPTIVVNENDRIVHFAGDLAPFVNLPRGPADWLAPDLVRAPINIEVRTLLHRARRSDTAVRGDKYTLEIAGRTVQVRPAAFQNKVGESTLVMLAFEMSEVALPPASEGGESEAADSGLGTLVQELQSELATTREHLQSVIEEVESSNEELQTLNEELQSANEELQSTNEELQTSNEELQSTNEELTTTNQELEVRTLELEVSRSDLQNVKESLDVGILVLNADHTVTQFNERLLEFLDPSSIGDGVSLSKLRWRPGFAGLGDDCAQVERTGEPLHRIIGSPDGTFCKLSFAPYMQRGAIEGAVIRVEDVSEEQQMQSLLREREALFRVMLESGASGMALLDGKGNIVRGNRALARLLGVQEPQCTGTHLHDRIHPEEQPLYRSALSALLNRESEHRQFEARLRSADGNWIWASISAAAILDAEGTAGSTVMQIQDVSVRHQRQQKLVDEYTQLRVLNGLMRRVAERSDQRETRAQVLEDLSVVFENTRVSLLQRREGGTFEIIECVPGHGWSDATARQVHLGRSGPYLRRLLKEHIVAIDSVESEELPLEIQAAMRESGAEAQLDVAVFDGDHVQQILRIESGQGRKWSDSDVDLLQGVGDVLAIAERDQRMAALHQTTTRELAEQALRTSAALDHLSDIVLTTDPSGRIDYLNAPARRLLGDDAEDAVGLPFSRLALVTDTQTGDAINSIVDDCLRDRSIVDHGSVGIALSGQAPTPASLTAIPLLRNDGELLGATVVMSPRPAEPG